MTKHPPETSNPTGMPDPDDIKIDVINPRYKGATPGMVALALLQRPKKDSSLEADAEKNAMSLILFRAPPSIPDLQVSGAEVEPSSRFS